MMHYLDTNILIYSSVNQDPAKMDLSQSIVQELFDKDKLLLSPLSLQELIFTLFKLRVHSKITSRNWRSDLGWICAIRLSKAAGIVNYFEDFVNEDRAKTA